MEYQALKYIYQPATEKNATTLLLLHGTGGNETDLLPLANSFEQPMNVLSVRGNVMEHGMPRFFKRLGMGIFDEKDLSFRSAELVNFLIETAKKENFDVKKIVALGYSNGANIAGALLVDYPDFLAGAILFRPMQPYQQLPAFSAVNKVPVLLTSGEFDPTVDQNATTAYVSALSSAGYETLHKTLATSHQLTKEDVELATNWMKKQNLAAKG